MFSKRRRFVPSPGVCRCCAQRVVKGVYVVIVCAAGVDSSLCIYHCCCEVLTVEEQD